MSDVSVAGLTLVPTTHVLRQILAKGFTSEQIKKAFSEPRKVVASRTHPGQTRVMGSGVCLVGEIAGQTFRLITVFADGVLTPPRPDQMDTPEGREYAARYAAGMGRKRG